MNDTPPSVAVLAGDFREMRTYLEQTRAIAESASAAAASAEKSAAPLAGLLPHVLSEMQASRLSMQQIIEGRDKWAAEIQKERNKYIWTTITAIVTAVIAAIGSYAVGKATHNPAAITAPAK